MDELQRVVTSEESFNGGQVIIQVSDTTDGFFHQILIPAGKSGWVGYSFLATVRDGGITYFHATEFFDGVLPMCGVVVTLN